MRPVQVRQIDQKRFNALAAHSRSPAAAYVSEELAWYANEDETVLGVLLRDTVDDCRGEDRRDRRGRGCSRGVR